MKKKIATLSLLACLLCACSLSATEYNLQALAENDGLTLFNRNYQVHPEESPSIVTLDGQANDGIAWIDGAHFSQGKIEIEVKGDNRPGQSFVGIAFHGQDNDTYQAVYLRPFNFKNSNRSQHSLQYISSPNHHWQTLRNQYPGKYESSITPAPLPESWVKLSLRVQDGVLSVHVNDSTTPELVVELIESQGSGEVGLWVGNQSAGAFRNLKIKQ